MATSNNGESSSSQPDIPSHSQSDAEPEGEGLIGETSDAPLWFYDVMREDEIDEDDEDDLDYEYDELEEEEEEYRYMDGGTLNLTIIDNDDDEHPDDEQDEADDASAERILDLLRTGARTGILTRGQLVALMRNPQLSNVLFQEDADDDAAFLGWQRTLRRRTPKDPNRFPKVPSEEGTKLMRSGVFGANDYGSRTSQHLSQRMLEGEMAIGGRGERNRNRDLVTQSLIPRSKPDKIIHFEDPVYSGQFSDDGNFFFACSQDFKVRMYDTSNPYNWRHYKTVSYPWGQWTLTDASLSPDNKWLAYTSIQSLVSIAPTDPVDTGEPYSLELDDGQRRGNRRGGFGIWSIRFSGDGRELVAGTSANSVVVYDIESRTVLHNIEAHRDDVNAVCFADRSSPHILYSGSDDSTIKVWDRRCMDSTKEVGAFVGHVEGLTYIDSKGDGRYILSNGKDQSMKLWDIRMAYGTDRFHEITPTNTRISGFDYRGGVYDEEDWDPHPKDNSVVTFRGHKVLRTLIRCHFSPPSSTNSRYVYSGSADGKVCIWNLDATMAGTVDVRAATMGTRQPDQHVRFNHLGDPDEWGTCVRDAAWHPNAPLLVASAWNGYNLARGTCTVHSFDDAMDDEGMAPMGESVNALLQSDPKFTDSTYEE